MSDQEDLGPSGKLDGPTHRFGIRVHYSDTDAGGVVYHAQYLVFADHARTEFLRLIDWPFTRLQQEHGVIWVVRRAELDLIRPARLEDRLVVETTLGEIRGASIQIRQRILRDSVTLVGLRLQLALISATGRPTRVPAALTRGLAPFLDTSPSQ